MARGALGPLGAIPPPGRAFLTAAGRLAGGAARPPLDDGLRAVMNEGAGLVALAPQAALLAAVALVSFGAALRLFRWS